MCLLCHKAAAEAYVHMHFFSAAILVFVILLTLFLQFSSHAPTTDNSEINEVASSEQVIPRGDNRRLTGPEIAELRADLLEGLYNPVLNKIAVRSKIETLDSDLLSIKIAAQIGKKDFTLARKELSFFTMDKGISEEAALLIGFMYTQVGKSKDAANIVQLGLATNIESPKLLFMMGNIFDSIGRSETALIYYAKSAEFKSISAIALRDSMANILMKLGRIVEAKEIFAIELDPPQKSLVRELVKAKYYAFRGEHEKGLSLLGSINAKHPIPAVTLLQAQIANLSAKPDMAIELLTQLKLLSPSSYPVADVALTEALSHLLNHSPDEAMAVFTTVGLSEKLPPTIELMLAIIKMSQGDVQSATDALTRASIPYPEIAGISALQSHLHSPALGPMIGLAYFCLGQGYYDQALDTVKVGLATHPNNILLHVLLAEIYRQSDKYTMALAEYKHLSSMMPESLSLRLMLARAYEDVTMDQQALRVYEALSKERPDYPQAQLAYGKLLESLGEWDKAKSNYEWSLNFKPDSVPLLVALGWSLSHLEDWEALKAVTHSLKANKNANPALALHLEGWTAYQQNDRSLAVKLLTQALAKAPDNAEATYHLGMAYAGIGEKQKGDNLLQHAFFFPELAKKYRK